jgi:hypothetical protein
MHEAASGLPVDPRRVAPSESDAVAHQDESRVDRFRAFRMWLCSDKARDRGKAQGDSHRFPERGQGPGDQVQQERRRPSAKQAAPD